MNVIIKAWVEALESGSYKQGRGFLEKNGEYCCLGVLCRIYDEIHPGELEIETTEHGVTTFNWKSGH